MRKVKRWRYYCDFCKKAGGHAGHMRNHEKHCTNNPNRECGMCNVCNSLPNHNELIELLATFPGETIEPFDPDTAPYKSIKDEKSLIEFRKKADGCPACMLAALRQSGIFMENFDYAKEAKEFWAEVNANLPGYY